MRAWVSLIFLVIILALLESYQAVNPSDQRARAAALPTHLVQCYSDPYLHSRARRVPQTISTLVDLVQRAERQPGFVVDLRVMTTTLLHRFRVDGLERDPKVTARAGVTPYRPTGLQYARFKVLMTQMLSGNANLFPEDTILTGVEQCTLHMMLSSAVDPWERGDESTVCPRQYPVPRRDGGVYWPAHRTYPDRGIGPRDGVNVNVFMRDNVPPLPTDGADPSGAISPCPVEEGVVRERLGAGHEDHSLSPGAVLAGLAAGLQPQAVALAALLSPSHLARLRADYTDPRAARDSATVSNLWAATLAGDLAEVAAYQAPSVGTSRLGQGLKLGPSGVWNDTDVPRVRYLSRERPGSPDLSPVQHWEMTDAEIRGGVDGLVLGQHISDWLSRMSRLKLSQVLEMYYSARGIAFQPEIRVCQRGEAVRSILTPEQLFEQTAAFARTLADSSPEAPYMTEAALRNFTASSVATFLRYAVDLLTGDACESRPVMDVGANSLVILDTTWRKDTALKFITLLAAGTDVSYYGSRIAVLNGEQGRWIVPFTDSPVRMVTKWMETDGADGNWPTYLDLPLSLKSVQNLLISRAESESSSGAIGSVRGDVVFIMAASSTISDADMRHAKTIIPRIKEISPDTRLVYIVSPGGIASKDRLQELVNVDYNGDDTVLEVSDLSPANVANSVTNLLRGISGRLTPAECVLVTTAPSPSDARPSMAPRGAGVPVTRAPAVSTTPHVWPMDKQNRGVSSLAWSSPSSKLVRGELEDYVLPGQLRLFRVHPSYTRPGQAVTVEVNSVGYGDLRACMWKGAAPGGVRAALREAMQAMQALRAPEEGDDGGQGGSSGLPQAECQNVAGTGRVNITISEPCAGKCAPLFFSVAASKSNFRCTEDDCRFPDQVRFIVRVSGLRCSWADWTASATPIHNISLFIFSLSIFVTCYFHHFPRGLCNLI